MRRPGVPATSRRAVLACAGAACAVALTGCARYSSNNGGITGGQPGSSSPEPAGSNESRVLATTAEVPVGGGKILTAQKIVITQPQAGTFDAFTAVCTHLGCLVGTVAGGTINCPCHGSKFSISDGSVVNGPATAPLAPVKIKVQGTSIVQA